MNKSSYPIKVSVIVPLYNSEKYISECLESIRNQTYKNIEIIVVNDGSTDNSMQIVQSIAKEDNRVIICSQVNRGASAARNVGLKYATGQYVQFLDADDRMDINKIQFQIQLLEKIGFPQDSVSFSKWSMFNTSIMDMPSNQKAVWHDYDHPLDLLLDFPIIGCCLPNSSYLVPTKLIELVGGWNETLTLNDDGEFFARVIQKAHKLLYSDDSIVYYRSTPNSVSKTMSPTYADSWIRSLITTADIIVSRKHPLSEQAVCKMLSSCLCCLYPYYSKARKKGEEYLKTLFPHYVVKYPKLNWKEKLYYKIQSLRNIDLK